MASSSGSLFLNTPPTTQPYTDLVAINVSTHLPIKLTPTNYVAWSKQMQSMLIGYGLSGYVTGSSPCPPSTITTEGKEAENPSFAY